MSRGLGRKPDADKPGFSEEHEPRFGSRPPAIFQRDFTLRQHVVESLDQGPTSTCVSNQIVLAYRAAWDASGVKKALASRLHNYYHARAFTGDQYEDGGTYIHSGVNGGAKFGFPDESVWPFSHDPARINRRPSFTAEHDGADWKGPELYYRIVAAGAGLVEAIKTALFVNRAPVVFGTDVSVAFTMGDGRGVVDRPDPDDAIAGGHALGIYGWHELDNGETTFELNTSWLDFGPDDDGFFWVTERYITWPQSSDFNVLQLAV